MRRVILLGVVLVAGCTSDQTMRYDGVTPGAGDAIAANTVLQMVDPWQRGVQDTTLIVHAPASASTATAAADDGGAQASEAPPQPTPMGVSN